MGMEISPSIQPLLKSNRVSVLTVEESRQEIRAVTEPEDLEELDAETREVINVVTADHCLNYVTHVSHTNCIRLLSGETVFDN